MEKLTSPWNSPIFVTKNKSGKYRMIRDLFTEWNYLSSLVPKGQSIIINDLTDCFLL